MDPTNIQFMFFRISWRYDCYPRSLNQIMQIDAYPTINPGGRFEIAHGVLVECENKLLMREYKSVVNELKTIHSYNGFVITQLLHAWYGYIEDFKYNVNYPCRGKIARRHKKYFIDHVEEELISYVCHPSRYDRFEDLGFFDDE